MPRTIVETLNLSKLDLPSVVAEDGVVVLIIGRRATGKSVLAMNVLRAAGLLDKETRGHVYSPTEETTPFYGPAFADAPDVRVISEYSPTSLVLNNVGGLGVDKRGGSTRSFVVFDNCMYDANWADAREINRLFASARRTRTTVVLTIPYAFELPPFLRSYVDYVFMLRENNVQCLKRLHQLYAPVFDELDVFSKVMDDVTKDKGTCVVIDNAPKSSRLEDHVLWYAADSPAATE